MGRRSREWEAALATMMMERAACCLHEANEAGDAGQKSLFGANHPGSQPLTLWGHEGIGVGSFGEIKTVISNIDAFFFY